MLQQLFDEETLIELNDHWYEEDGAPAHLSKVVLDWLQTSFPERLISIESSFPWLANSSDLYPLHFYLWELVKQEVFAANPQSIAETKELIRTILAEIPQATLQRTIGNFECRLDLCIAALGGPLKRRNSAYDQ